MQELFAKMGIHTINPYLEKAYSCAVQEQGIPEWLSEEFIKKLHTETNMIQYFLDELLSALSVIQKDSELLLYAKTIYYGIKMDKPVGEVLGNILLPKAPEGIEYTLAYDLLGMFPLLALMYESYHMLLKRGVDKELLDRTYTAMDGYMGESRAITGKLCLMQLHFNWMFRYAKGYILNVGRLNFELLPQGMPKHGFMLFQNKEQQFKVMISGKKIHKSGEIYGSYLAEEEEGSFLSDFFETDEAYIGYCVNGETELVETHKTSLPKSQWEKVATCNDALIAVHIPEDGRLDEQACLEAYHKAVPLFKDTFGEYDIKAFVCFSWLMSVQLDKILKPESNIRKFKSRFSCFPTYSSARAVFIFVFKQRVGDLSTFDFDTLTETSTLTKNIKELYKRGEAIQECGGIFPL